MDLQFPWSLFIWGGIMDSNILAYPAPSSTFFFLFLELVQDNLLS